MLYLLSLNLFTFSDKQKAKERQEYPALILVQLILKILKECEKVSKNKKLVLELQNENLIHQTI